jgi:hypothetical protein
MLTQERVAGYLLERGLLAPAAVLDDELTVRDASSRNRNYRVQTRDGSGYVLKQGVGPDTQATIANEAAVYHRLALGDVQLSGLLPRFGGYDPDEGLLVLELVRGAEDLHTHHLGGSFSASPAAAVGRALGLLHSRTGPLVGEVTAPAASASAAPAPAAATPPSPVSAATPAPWTPAPWVLSLHRPDASVFRDVSAAGLELIRIVQRTEGFGELLDGLRARWAPSSLIHGDVKWSNVLVVGAGTPQESVKLIDWESAMVGDPSWDVGSALSQYLSFWLFSIPLTGGEAPERFPELAAYPLDAMKPALGACWVAYADAAGIAGSEVEQQLTRAVEMAAARLVQVAFEASQEQQQLASSVVLHLQLAHNLLARPREAPAELLGIRVGR